MRTQELDLVLKIMLESQPNVSDLNFTVGKPLQVESVGNLMPVAFDPPIRTLTPYQTEEIALSLIRGDRRLTETLLREGACDLSYQVQGLARLRVNIFSQRGNYSIVLRRLATQIPTIDQLKLPPVFHKISNELNGLILVTGATGSGKSTSLAALLDEINDRKAIHIITLEDPVEYSHPHKQATFNQRELGRDFDSFANGLRAALRQAPKIILVGEMRDRETVEIALAAAETGHLVLSTLHTIDAGQTISRIVGMFEQDEEKFVRIRLAETLRWVVAQRLLPKVGGDRIAAFEIMGSNLRIKELVLNGESEEKTFYEIMEDGEAFGMRTFDKSIVDLYKEGLITADTAMAFASKKNVVGRGIDVIKSAKGEKTSDIAGLKMDMEYDRRM
ncbi:MAG: type IV pilus twitching motility protein PilT [bacterium]